MRERVSFWLQPTKSFEEGAPQRDEYDSDEAHDAACERYDAEWLLEYECTGCADAALWDCPQHSPEKRRTITR